MQPQQPSAFTPVPDDHRGWAHLAGHRVPHARRISGGQYLQLRGRRALPPVHPDGGRVDRGYLRTAAGRSSARSRSAAAHSTRRRPRWPKCTAAWRKAKRATAVWSRILPAPSSSSEQGKIVLANRAALEMFGFDPNHELQGRSLFDFVAPEGRELAEQLHRALSARAMHITPREIRLIRPDGKVLDVEFAASSSLQDGGYSIQIVLRDISQRKQDEAVNARLISAIEQVCESIVITDPDGNIVYVNPAFERITGFSRQEALGKNPSVLKSGRHPTRVLRPALEYAQVRRSLERPLYQPRQRRPNLRRRSDHRADLRPLRHNRQLRGRQARRYPGNRAARAAAPVAEDGRHRPPGRRRCPRLQQHAHGHRQLRRTARQRAPRGRSPAQPHSADPARRPALRLAHPPAAGLQPQAGARAPGSRLQRHSL